MNKKIITALFVLALLLVSQFSFVSQANAAAVFNTHSLDKPTFRALNLTETDPTCRSCWVSSVTADPGDIISFDVYYHNNSNETAKNVVIRVSLPQGEVINRTVNAEISADNASTVSGSVSINLSQARSITIVPNSVRWFPDQAAFGTSNFSFSQNGDEIVSSGGLRLGDIGAGFSHQGHVAFKARVSTYSNSDNGGTGGSGGSGNNDTTIRNPGPNPQANLE